MATRSPEFDVSFEVGRITSFINRVVREAAADGVVLGLSGGIDSAVTGALCVKALGKSRVLGLLMPSDHTPKEDIGDARTISDTWGIRIETIPISSMTKALLGLASIKGTKVAQANIEARTRMMISYYHANSLGYLVAGTGDRSESLLGYFCYDIKTRIVTTDGPKGIEELKSGDTVFSLEPKSRELVQAMVDGIFVFDYHGKLIRFGGRGTDIAVTPNHRMLIQTSSSSPDSPARFRSAEDCLKSKKTLLPIPAGWAGREGLPSWIELSFKQRNISRKVQLAIEDVMYMFGLFIGDGCAVKTIVVAPTKSNLTRQRYGSMPRDKSGRYVLLPSIMEDPQMKSYDEFETDFALQSYTKDGARNRLLGILTKYKIGYSLTRDLVRVPSKGIYEFFVQCGIGALNKHIPRWLLDYPSNYLVWLLRGLKDSDATHAEDQNVYYTSSEKLKDDFVELCYKVGRRATVTVREPRDSVIKGKKFRTGTSYEISFSSKHRLQHAIENRLAKAVDYVGKVWCPSVPPYENVLVERNGKYMLSGNTKFGDGGVDFLPISHLYKTQVRQLGSYLGLPKSVVEKPASPQLWPGHKASDEIPADYERLDIALHHLFDLRRSPLEAAAKSGLPLSVVEKALEMHKKSEHKRNLPPSL